MAIQVVCALDHVIATPVRYKVKRPGRQHEDYLLFLALSAEYQRHFCRVTPIPPFSVALWCDDLCVVMDMQRGDYLELVRLLYQRGVMFLSVAGMPKTLQEMEVLSLVTPSKAAARLDIAQVRQRVRESIEWREKRMRGVAD